jgi:hypothetical protein
MTDHDELAKELAVVNATARFQHLAIVGALAERHLVDPAMVANWAEFFAKGMENSAGNGPANREHLEKGSDPVARLCEAARKPREAVREFGLMRL